MDEDLLCQDSLQSCHQAILKDDFLDLGDETDIKAYLSNTDSNQINTGDKFPCKMEDWDQDVLLSNAGLPEMNPLLELNVEDDFQKMLNDWENQIDSLQATETPAENVHYILPTMEDRTSNDTDNQTLLNEDSYVLQDSASIAASSDASNDALMNDASNDAFSGKSEADADDEKMTEAKQEESKKPARPSLTGIVISCGPSGHFETYEVLEAPDAEQLLDQFEAVGDFFGAEDYPCSSQQAPYKKAQILAAVQNHFSVNNGDSTVRRKPKIVPSHRIKDALPKEVIEKIKSSSVKSRTIAIIEPVHHGDGRTNATFNHLNNTPYELPVAKTRGVAPQASTTRFQEAATNLNRSKQFRQMGTLSPQPAQISLDHDYCSSANKISKRSRVTVAPTTYQRTVATYSSSTIKNAGYKREFTTYPGAKNIITSSGSMMVKGASQQPMVTVKKSVSMPIVVSSSSGFTTTSRPYVRVSTGSRVVTANLLKPTPLSSASMLRSESGPTIATTSKLLPDVRQKSFRRGSAAVTTSKVIKSSMLEQHLLLPRSPKPVVCVQSVRRRDSDHKKDSGLESGEMSDTSEQSVSAVNDEESTLYSKVPQYLTTVTVKNSDSTISPADESGYDRLPAYIKGVSRVSKDSEKEEYSLVKCIGGKKVSVVSPIIKQDGRGKKVVIVHASSNDHTGRRVLAKDIRERHCSSSSEASSTSISGGRTVIKDSVRMSTRSMTTRRHLKSPKRRRSRSSSTSSNCSTTSDTEDSVKKVIAIKRRHSWRKASNSPSPPSRRRRFRSPSNEKRGPVASGGSGRFTRDKQRREQEARQLYQEEDRRNEERRIVYVGKIAEGTSRADIRKRFEVFGPVLEISVHFRDRGDNYGFITFKYKVDAYEAIEHGNDDPSYPTVDLCFGGRRAFCKEKYSDLDSHHGALEPPTEEMDKYRLRKPSRVGGSDFDLLLQQARAGLRK